MRGFLFLLFLLSAVLFCAACANAAVVGPACPAQGTCVLAVPVTAEVEVAAVVAPAVAVVSPGVAVRVNTPPVGLVPRVLRGTASLLAGRPAITNRLDVRINTRNAAVRVHVNR